MNLELALEQLFDALSRGDRPRARQVIASQLDEGLSPQELVIDLLWPTYESLEKLHRSDQIEELAYRFATRLLRVLVDQAACELPRRSLGGRRIFAVSGPSESDDLGAQMAVDLLEANGFDVTFAGGGIPGDEIMSHTHTHRPDILLMFCSAPSDLPQIREVIDKLREMNATPHTQVVVGGGVFNRAEGLAEEIGADLWACDPLELVEELIENPEVRAEESQRTVGRKRRPNQAA